MNKDLLKKSGILAGILLLIGIILEGILFLIGSWLDIRYIAILSGIFAAYFVGQIYTSKFKEIMPKKLRLKVSSIVILIQLVLSILYGLFMDLELRLWLIISIIVSIIYFFLVYWSLGRAGKIYLNIIKNRKLRKIKE